MNGETTHVTVCCTKSQQSSREDAHLTLPIYFQVTPTIEDPSIFGHIEEVLKQAV
jgi:hypothetical protein